MHPRIQLQSSDIHGHCGLICNTMVHFHFDKEATNCCVKNIRGVVWAFSEGDVGFLLLHCKHRRKKKRLTALNCIFISFTFKSKSTNRNSCAIANRRAELWDIYLFLVYSFQVLIVAREFWHAGETKNKKQNQTNTNLASLGICLSNVLTGILFTYVGLILFWKSARPVFKNQSFIKDQFKSRRRVARCILVIFSPKEV